MTTTPASPGPSAAISPLVEQPISGTPGAISRMPASRVCGSWATEKTTSSAASARPSTAPATASRPASVEPAAAERPLPVHLWRAPMS